MKRTLVLLTLLVAIPAAALEDATPPEPTQNPSAPYRLFATQNIFMFLKKVRYSHWANLAGAVEHR
jgi:hypothetical protein